MKQATIPNDADQKVLTAEHVPAGRSGDPTELTQSMGRLLADTFRLILKTQNFHWNVEGPQFSALHALFEEQYDELREALDEIAERMRALGVYAPGSFEEFEQLSTISDSKGRLTATEMCQTLASDNRSVSESAARVVRCAAELGDEGTADLATGRVRVNDKAAWILKSHVA